MKIVKYYKIQEIIEFLTNGQPIYTDPKYFRDYGWLMSGTIPTVQRDGAQLPQVENFSALNKF